MTDDGPANLARRIRRALAVLDRRLGPNPYAALVDMVTEAKAILRGEGS